MRVASTKALKWGTGPLIIVHEGMLQVPQVGEIVDACGFTSSFDKVFRPGDKSTIEITSIFFDGFESGSPVDRPNNEHRLIVTFLHEAVHWVRDEVGAPNLVDPITLRGPRKEAGRFFEELAFGADKGVCTDESIFDALLSRRL